MKANDRSVNNVFLLRKKIEERCSERKEEKQDLE